MPRFKVQKIIYTRITYNVDAVNIDKAVEQAKAAELKQQEHETEVLGQTPWQANVVTE